MIDFRTADNTEKRILSDGITEINREKRMHFWLQVIVWGAIYIVSITLIMMVFVGQNDNSPAKIKRYKGPKPRFEDYEDYIMNDFFGCSFDNQTGKIDMVTGVFSNYVQIMEPEDYDYSKLDNIELRVQNEQYHRFISGETCYIIKYTDARPTWDKYDIVWKGLTLPPENGLV